MVASSKAVETATDTSISKLLTDLERRAHYAAVQTSTSRIAESLQVMLGQSMVAGMTGIADPKTIGRWARGEREPRGESERRLRDAFQIVTLLSLADSPAVARAWIVGMNPHLRDHAPFVILSEDAHSAPRVLAAARAFVANG